MKLTCPDCEAAIRSTDMNLDRLLASCASCHSVFSFADRFPDAAPPRAALERPEVGRPETLQVKSTDKGLCLESGWFSLTVIPLAFFAVAWDSFLVTWYATALTARNTPLIAFVFPICHVAVGVGITYFCIASFLNTTQVRIERDVLRVVHGPVPWWGNRDVPVFSLEQLFCEEKVTNSKNGVQHTYSVLALLKSGERIELLTGLDDRAKALFIEQQIETHLGIQDRPVAGELPR